MPRPPQRVILASHLVWTGYGHWLPNDVRGSGSTEVRKDGLKDLGPVHLGRKPVQPPRAVLRDFYRTAQDLLDHETLWFDAPMRAAVARGAGEAVRRHGYTTLAFAVCRNHAHAVVRAHRDRAEVIWHVLGQAMSDVLRSTGRVPADHPVWSHRPNKVYKHTFDDVRGAIGYVEENPTKEGLARQVYDFVTPYHR